MKNENHFTRRMLIITAHPDDETFGMGGTIAYYANEGVEVTLVCATKGEAGEADQHFLDKYKTMDALRVAELNCATNILGIKNVYFLNYRDSGMFGAEDNQHPSSLLQAPLTELEEKILHYIKQIRPQVILTFDPSGGYGHPDHIKIHEATKGAFEKCLRQRIEENIPRKIESSKLFFHTMPGGFITIAVKVLPLFGINPKKFGKNRDIDLTQLISSKYPIHVRVNCRSVIDIRNKASACYASQGGDRQSGFILSWMQRLLSYSESFTQYRAPLDKSQIKKDLFY